MADRTIATTVGRHSFWIRADATSRSIARDLCLCVVLALATACVILLWLSLTGLIPWAELESTWAGDPRAALLNPWLGPKTALLLGGLGIAFLLFATLSAIVGAPFVRIVLGEGLVVVLRRASAFASILAASVAVYLLKHVDPATLRTDFSLHSQVVTATLPTLLASVTFSLTCLIARPKAQRYLPTFLHALANVAPVMVGGSLVLALHQSLEPAFSLITTPLLSTISTQWALLWVEIGWFLLVLEVGLSAWAQFRRLRQGRRRLAWLVLLPGAIYIGLLVGPPVAGLHLALTYQPSCASLITDRQGRPLATYFRAGQPRVCVEASQISPWARLAFTAIEDPGVYTSPLAHSPVNPVRLVGVATGGLQTLRGEGEVSGGSGIAAQVVKNYWGRPLTQLAQSLSAPGLIVGAATVAEKIIVEFPAAWALERASLLVGREHLLTLYLNQVYFREDARGIQMAAQVFFAKNAADLTLTEAALLAGLPQAPNRLNPFQYPQRALARRQEVLAAMEREGYLAPGTATNLVGAGFNLNASTDEDKMSSPAFVQGPLMDWLEAQGQRQVSRDNLRIRTTLDLTLQKATEEAIGTRLQALAVRGVNNAAAVALDPRTGEVLAWYGGRQATGGIWSVPDLVKDFPQQPGSAIKPLVYACALTMGVLGPDDWLDDTPRVIDGEFIANWDNASRGRRPAAEQLALSRNVPAAYLVSQMTPPGFARCLREVFQVQTDVFSQMPNVRLGLGLVDLPTIELARAYAILANGGLSVEPVPVLAVKSAGGHTLLEPPIPLGQRRLNNTIADWVTRALAQGSNSRLVPNGLVTKTGTTASSSYAVGYGPGLVIAVWVGRTEPGKGRLAIPHEVSGADGAGAVLASLVAR